MSAIPGANETFYWIGMKRNTRLVFIMACIHQNAASGEFFFAGSCFSFSPLAAF